MSGHTGMTSMIELEKWSHLQILKQSLETIPLTFDYTAELSNAWPTILSNVARAEAIDRELY